MRVTSGEASYFALSRLDPGAGLDDVLGRATILSIPVLPGSVTENLVHLEQDAAELAEKLSERLKQPVKIEDVEHRQQKVGEVIAPPLPSRLPDRKA